MNSEGIFPACIAHISIYHIWTFGTFFVLSHCLVSFSIQIHFFALIRAFGSAEVKFYNGPRAMGAAYTILSNVQV